MQHNLINRIFKHLISNYRKDHLKKSKKKIKATYNNRKNKKLQLNGAVKAAILLI